MMFVEICTLIQTLTGFPIGSRLQFGHWAQDKPQRAILISETGGSPEFYPNVDVIDVAIQVLCRAETYLEARADAYAVFHALHGTNNWNLARLVGSGPDYLAMTVEAVAIPYYLGEDGNRRHIFSTNYIFRMEEGSCAEPASGSGI
jgi:hypothetical protein